MLVSRPVENIAKDTGMYRVYLYGALYTNDLETAAILDIEGDEYTIEPYASPTSYTLKENQAGYEAFTEAEKFVMSHRSAKSYGSREILAPDGTVVGYELRPLYRLPELGINDPVNVSYSLMPDKKIMFNVWLNERVGQRLLLQLR